MTKDRDLKQKFSLVVTGPEMSETSKKDSSVEDGKVKKETKQEELVRVEALQRMKLSLASCLRVCECGEVGAAQLLVGNISRPPPRLPRHSTGFSLSPLHDP